MNKKSYMIYFLMLIILTSLSITILPFSAQANPTPYMSVDASSTTVDLGETFPINVNVTDVTDLAVWDFALLYRNDILHGVNATEGPFLKTGGNTFFWQVQFTDQYNETHGRIYLTCSLLGSIPGVDGSGTLATINFQAVGGGNTTLHLTDTVLGDSQANPIDHTTNDGNIQVIGVSDIAITNVTPSKTIVGQSYTMKINVTVENQGDTTETWNVTAYANTTVIETREITLTSGNSTNILFSWDTTGLTEYANCTISAYAHPVLGETELADNNFTYGIVTIVHIGDVNMDEWVDMMDLYLIALHYGEICGDPGFDGNMDVNCGGWIDMMDLYLTALQYGWHT